MSSKACHQCAYPLGEAQSECPECGLPWVASPEPTDSKECRRCGALLAAEEAVCSRCGTEWSWLLRKPLDVQYLSTHIACEVHGMSCTLKRVIPTWIRVLTLVACGTLMCVFLFVIGKYSRFHFPTPLPVLIPVGFMMAWMLMALAESAGFQNPLRVTRDRFQCGIHKFPRVPGERITLRATPPVRVVGLEGVEPQIARLIMVVHSVHGDLYPLHRPFGVRRSDLIAIGRLNAFLRASEVPER